MLVLSRRINESIVINEEIQVRVVKINSSVVRIGIEAHESISIRRGELLPKLKQDSEPNPNAPEVNGVIINHDCV